MSARERLQRWAQCHSNVTPLDGTDRNSPTFGDLRAVLAEKPILSPMPVQTALAEGIASIAITFAQQRTLHPLADDLHRPINILPQKALYDLRLAYSRGNEAIGMAKTEAPLAQRRARLAAMANALARSGALIAASIERVHHEIALIDAGTFEISRPQGGSDAERNAA